MDQVVAAQLVQANERVPGLLYVPDFLSSEEEQALLDEVDRNEWRTDLKRRVQHYGWLYSYKERRVMQGERLGPLPAWLQQVADRLLAAGLTRLAFDQAIVNEYLPGQGIAPHVDRREHFAEEIVTISLGSNIVMDFTHPPSGAVHHQLLQRRSAACLMGEARNVWTHGIAPRRSDPDTSGHRVQRGRRVSLTFRRVLQQQQQHQPKQAQQLQTQAQVQIQAQK